MTSSSGSRVDTDSPRPPSIVVAAPLQSRLLMNDLTDVGLASRRALGEGGCSTCVGFVQARPCCTQELSLSLLIPRAQGRGRKDRSQSPLPLRTQRYDSTMCTVSKVPGDAGVF